jgi:hypothetical protein
MKHDASKGKLLFSGRKIDTDENNDYFSHRLMSDKDPMNMTIEASKDDTFTLNEIKSQNALSRGDIS